MADPSLHGGRRVSLVAATTAVLLLLGLTLVAVGLRGHAGPPSPDRAMATAKGAALAPNPGTPSKRTTKPQQGHTPSPPSGSRGSGGGDFGPILNASRPVGVDIPAIDVHSASIVDLALEADGSIEVPEDASEPGWFSPGPSPGQFGPAVIAGHVDSEQGPAVFYRLGELSPGDQVQVTRADGITATFVIDRVAAYAKAAFPTHQVYGDTTNRAELRLITCGGSYDEDAGYLGNVVAFAHLVRSS